MRRQGLEDNQRHHTMFLVLIVSLGILYAAIYALVMPPWGLLDESQHYHYVQVIAEEYRLPVMWQDQLSADIIDSIFDVKRYVTLGAAQMPSRNQVMTPGRLDSESYEAYQPPLYYVLLALFYPLGGPDVLSKLFFLRLITVLLGSVTLIAVWFSSRVLFRKHLWVSIAATLFVALLPERVASISQINNDVLLEVLCAIAFYWLAIVIKDKITWRRTLLVSVTLSLAVLSKLSALGIVVIIAGVWFILGRRSFRRWQESAGHAFSIIAIVSISAAPLFIRNLILYNDPTGMRAFLVQAGGDLANGSFPERLATGTLDLFRNSWVILWDGVAVVTKPGATILFASLLIILIWMTGATIKAWLSKDILLSHHITEIGLVAIVVVSLSVLSGYIRGFLPTVQGRFLFPVTVPTAWLMGPGLWLTGKRRRGVVATAFFAIELALGGSVLLFHSLPKYYAPRADAFSGYWRQTVYLFSDKGLFWDKPDFVTRPLLLGVLTGFVFGGLFLVIWGIWAYDFPLELKKIQAIWRYFGRVWQVLKPDVPDAHQPLAVGHATWVHQFTRVWKDPLTWAGVGLLAFYLVWVSFYPPDIFWSLDEGGKFLHLQSVVKSGELNAFVKYPWQSLDRKLEFVPLYFWSQAQGQIYSWWPVGFPFISIPFYKLLGYTGLYFLPGVFGAVSAIFSGLIFRQIIPAARKLSAFVAIIIGLATPIAFYSTTFWEHTLNTGLFIVGFWAVLKAWNTQKIYWLVLSGVFLSISTFFRIDTVIFVVAVGFVLLLIRWRWSILLGTVYLLSCIPWFYFNWLMMENILSRQFIPGMTGISARPFLGFRSAGWLFVPYSLFGAPDIGGLFIPQNILLLATLLLIAAVIMPFFRKWHYGLLPVYLGLLALCGWALVQPEGYRSVHGFVLIAPHIIFATWLYVACKDVRQSVFPLMGLSITSIYIVVYFIRGWVAAGGLQWGPRYLLIFYPLVVIASISGIRLNWAGWTKQFKYALISLYGLGLFMGTGFELRGLQSARQTRTYYQQTQAEIQQLNTDAIVAECSWLGMVMPDIYWDRPLFFVEGDDAMTHWRQLAEENNIESACTISMDLCKLTSLDKIASYRQNNPSGLEKECYSVRE